MLLRIQKESKQRVGSISTDSNKPKANFESIKGMTKIIFLGMLTVSLLGYSQWPQTERDFESFNHILEEHFWLSDPSIYETPEDVQVYDIQRGISPNGDGFNDYFDLTGHEVKKLIIYNRNGIVLYSKTDYTNEWEGQDKNGDELPIGTYFYRIIKNDNKHSTGWIYINREL